MGMIYLSEPEMEKFIDHQESIDACEEMFREEAHGRAEQKPNIQLNPPGLRYLLKAGGIYYKDAFGYKGYGAAGRRLCFLFKLGQGLVAIMDAEGLTQSRTAAIAAVGTKYMANPGDSSLGIFGTGFEAYSEVEAVHRVRPLKFVKAWSRTEENRVGFAKRCAEMLGIEVVPASSAEDCCKDVQIITTVTSANDPVLFGKWLSKGQHINAVGATRPHRREMDDDAVAMSDMIVVESMPTAVSECGELISVTSKGRVLWHMVRELKDVVTGVYKRKSADDITMLTTIGTGAEDIACAEYIYNKAIAAGAGSAMPNWPEPGTGRGSSLPRPVLLKQAETYEGRRASSTE